MRNGMNKLLAVTAVLACVCMWGCFSWFEDETTMSVSKKRTEGYLTAFVNDSLAIVWNGRVWGTYNKSCDYYDSCEKGTLNQGVFLVNYREKRPPLWGDTVDGKRLLENWWGCAGCQKVEMGSTLQMGRIWFAGKRMD